MANLGATFTGIANIERATFALTHGVQPSTGQIEFTPQAAIPNVIGTLAISDGLVTFVLVNALLDSASFIRDGSGHAVAATVMDRRWKWRFGEIYGEYNIRGADGELPISGRRTPAQLADLLLTAMGEAGVPLGALPTDPLPHVRWDGHNPADELRRLLDLWGCRIGLDVTGACRIWREGVGSAAPAGPIERAGGELNPPNAPDSVRVLFAPTIVGARLPLEAVGRDTDGTVKPIDQLSYTPSDGWAKEPDTFPNIASNEAAIVPCEQTVFRWYRIKDTALTIPGVGAVTTLDEILPILDRQVEVWPDPETGEMRPKPVAVQGLYWIRNSGPPQNSTEDDNWEVPIPFRVLTDLGVIAFDERVKSFNGSPPSPSTYTFPPAELTADVAFGVRNNLRQRHRWAYLHFTGLANGTGPQPVHAEEAGGLLVFQSRANPSDSAFSWQFGAGGDPSILNNRAQEYISGTLAKYGAVASEELTYSGIVAVPIDGLNVQMSISVGPDGAYTVLSRVRESDVFAVPYREQGPLRQGAETPEEVQQLFRAER